MERKFGLGGMVVQSIPNILEDGGEQSARKHTVSAQTGIQEIPY